ncbi:hypothetical protein [Streptomyces griseomycini]|uniref:MFS family permease n=1 Tax=Streptomyces griseomycini TaxID=66895 RepID=A0A7W7PW54_9ACTN|nr:hypothetical protein [Streptomyces griseomycini]MBB4902435.1 MFS family permease [Streptomyces griseomycini]GGR46218.1 hypothetical protein GCM10015536_60030 [Streptomyces griseomycini]
MIVLRGLPGLTAAVFAPSALSYVAQHIAPQRRSTSLTCITSGMPAAAAVVQTGAQAVAAGIGWASDGVDADVRAGGGGCRDAAEGTVFCSAPFPPVIGDQSALCR